MIWLDADAALDLCHGHGRSSAKNGCKVAFVLGVQMKNHGESRAGIRRDRLEKGLKGLNSPRRSANRGYGDLMALIRIAGSLLLSGHSFTPLTQKREALSVSTDDPEPPVRSRAYAICDLT